MSEHLTAPVLSIPVQAAPIALGPEGGGVTAGGVEPSATPCSKLTGLARQLCYATKYGVSV